MKDSITILCYGDSNTYGYIPVKGGRYPKDVRWTGRLQTILGNRYEIIEEGCNGRTTMFDDPLEDGKNGLTYLKPCLNSHRPVDIVILMLGSNDLKTRFKLSAKEISEAAGVLVRETQEFLREKQEYEPEIILVAPPVIGEDIDNSTSSSFDRSAIDRSKEFSYLYQKIANENKCLFFDAAKSVNSSKEDSLHLTPEAHKKFAEDIAELIKSFTEK